MFCRKAVDIKQTVPLCLVAGPNCRSRQRRFPVLLPRSMKARGASLPSVSSSTFHSISQQPTHQVNARTYPQRRRPYLLYPSIHSDHFANTQRRRRTKERRDKGTKKRRNEGMNGLCHVATTTANDERTTNDERRTANDERRTANDERRTTNDERRTTNDERRTTNDERRTNDDV